MDQIGNLTKFWKNKRVLITGHTGFKGSWLSIILTLFKARITGYALKPKKNSLFIQAKLKNKLHNSYYRDINDHDFLEKVIKKDKPEIIIHLASQAIVLESYKNPYQTFKTNFFGTLNLLEIIKKNNFVKSAIFVTTDKVYKIKNKKKKYVEKDELGGTDPYSSSKVSQEILVNSYIKSFFSQSKKSFNKASTARSGNVVGGGDYSKNRLIPDLIKSINSNKPIFLRNPQHVRPWQHVLEPLNGYLILAKYQYQKKLSLSERTWNFGPLDRNFVNVNKIAIKSQKIFKKLKIRIAKKKINSFKETDVLKLSSKKAISILSWKQKWDIDQTLKKVFEWNNMKKNKISPYIICQKQIKEYFRF